MLKSCLANNINIPEWRLSLLLICRSCKLQRESERGGGQLSNNNEGERERVVEAGRRNDEATA